MTRNQRRVHTLTWAILIPVLAGLIWVSLSQRADFPKQQIPSSVESGETFE
jgi:hypothetical protein